MMAHWITEGIVPAVVTAILIGVLHSGCYNDVGELLYPVCDTNNVTYSKTIKPILERECYDCHSGFSPDGGLDLEGYSGANIAATNTLRMEGNLLYRIKNDSIPRMPYYLPNLDSCTIAKIEAWVNAGAPDN